MPFTLPPLPYPIDALEPFISGKTVEFHYSKHHQTYVNNLNKLTEGTPLADKPLEEVVITSEGGIFNNAAQVWNHTFYWNCLKPGGGGAPSGPIASKINEAFGSYEKFVEEFKNAGLTQFGSGWAWLVLEDGKLKVTKTGNADLPMKHGQKAIITLSLIHISEPTRPY